MEDIHQTWLWPMSWAGLCDRSAAAPGLLGSGGWALGLWCPMNLPITALMAAMA